MFYDIMIRGRDISTEFYPGSFRAFEAQTSYCLLKRKECHTIMTKQGACNGHVN